MSILDTVNLASRSTHNEHSIFNISLMNSHRYTQNNFSFGVLKDVKGLPSSVECKLIEEREALFTELRDVGIELVSRTPSSNIHCISPAFQIKVL